MSRSRASAGRRLYRIIYNAAATSASNRYKFNGILMDIKGLLETLAGQGEEFKISKAILTVRSSNPANGGSITTFHEELIHIAAMVSDQSIAAADPGENSLQGYLDDDFDVMTAGDYELQRLGVIRTKGSQGSMQTMGTVSTTSAWSYGSMTVDVTKVLQKASGLLARSAILSTNPYIAFVATGIGNLTNSPPTFNILLEVEGNLAQKPLRMLA